MYTRNSRLVLFLSVLAALCVSGFGGAFGGAFAQTVLNANDLTPAALSAPLAVESFVLVAAEGKGVTIETVDKARTAPDGEVFNARIKLNGSGAKEFRAIKFVASGPATLRVYANSSSKTDARTLRVADEAGTVIGEIPAPADNEADSGLAKVALPKAGAYFIYSAGSGINIYQLIIE